jgi:hypothetical protein
MRAYTLDSLRAYCEHGCRASEKMKLENSDKPAKRKIVFDSPLFERWLGGSII